MCTPDRRAFLQSWEIVDRALSWPSVHGPCEHREVDKQKDPPSLMEARKGSETRTEGTLHRGTPSVETRQNDPT